MENKETKFRFYLNRQGVIGRQGIKGDKGFSPEISVEKDTLSEYILRITNESSYFLTTNLREHKEDRGGTYIRLDRTTGAMYAGEADRATTDTAGVVKMATPDEMMNADENSVVTPANLTDFVTDILVDYVTIAALDNKLLDYAKKVDVQAELAQCVKVTGNQNIAGKKVFSDRVYFNNGISSGKDIYGSNVITPKVTARDSLNGYTPDLINQDGFTLKVGVANNPNAPVNIQNGLRVNYFESEGKPVETVRNGQIYENIDSGNINNFISVDPATVDKAGIVKPDGTSITVDPDGTIHAESGTPSENTMTLDTDQEVNSSKTFLKDQAMKSNTLDVTTARNERGNAFIFSDKNGTQIAGVSSYVNNNGSPECRFIASNGTQSAFAGLGVTKDGQGFFEIPEPAEDSNNNDAVPSSWVNKKLDTKQPKGNYVKTVNNTTPDASGNVNVSGGGDVTKKYVDEQDAKKQDKFKTVAPLELKVITSEKVVGYEDVGAALNTTKKVVSNGSTGDAGTGYTKYEQYDDSAKPGMTNPPARIVIKLPRFGLVRIPAKVKDGDFALGYFNDNAEFIPVMNDMDFVDSSYWLNTQYVGRGDLTSIEEVNSPYLGRKFRFSKGVSRAFGNRNNNPGAYVSFNASQIPADTPVGRFLQITESNGLIHTVGWWYVRDDRTFACAGTMDERMGDTFIDGFRKCTHLVVYSSGETTTSYPKDQFGLYEIDHRIGWNLDVLKETVSTIPDTSNLFEKETVESLLVNLGQGLSVSADGKLQADSATSNISWDETKAIKMTSPFTAPCDGYICLKVTSQYSSNIRPSTLLWMADNYFPEILVGTPSRSLYYTAHAYDNKNYGYIYPITKGLTIREHYAGERVDPNYSFSVFLPRKGAQ